ncbi:metal ABC transporter solute-binding protein, Zn/Mn family [Mycolicibacterium vaccae]|uniref:Periplasmic solute binding protein n=1 Tax=Mycolicibacterium vaccae ATCC 25954 TaxID=1194972 RepID=K0US70_MYCVA|nr:zinc ABC transporter substrate-binding protein [Mycolicibacterium vaccae]ANI42280.1 ABC transporter substrate-binding protein [Mycolicibacterium vaccae 95051]EJZ09706.1 periplasmic solute binding protein [Mycolicibacterium vaccae ATCC 25954]
MSRSSRRLRALTATLAVCLPLSLSACGGADTAAPSAAGAPDCPASAVDVVVSVDQWGDIVTQLGGACAEVTTVLAGSSVDPHDYEPAPSDAVAFEGAQLVVVNGGHYDEWAVKLAATSAADARVVNAVELGGGHSDDDHGDHAHHDHSAGENPHVWYSPAVVTEVADAVTATLTELSPDAAGYFADRRAAFGESMKPYHDTIAAIRTGATGRTYGATESVFEDMATAVGLVDRTPAGYRAAAANESEPSPADLDAFLRLLADRGVDVLIYNIQTEGSVPQQLRSAAERAGVAVVEVTETLPDGAGSFQDWQVAQLDSLAEALGVRT